MGHKLIILLILLGINSYAVSQTSYSVNYTNGNRVVCSVIESDYMWLGTNGGLVKMNRATQQKTFYNVSNSGLPDNFITCIAIDSQGVKWIGTPSDLVRFDGSNWTVFHIDLDRILFAMINSIGIDSQDVKWISIGNGLLSFDGTEWTEHSSSLVDLEYSDIQSLAIDTQGAVWMGGDIIGVGSLGDLGLVKYDGNNWSYYNHENNQLQSDYISMVKFDNSGGLWVCHPSATDATGTLIIGGLTYYNGINWITYSSDNSEFPDEGAMAIAFDQQNIKWITTSNGVSRLSGNDWLNYSYPDSISEDFYGSSLCIDSQRIKWIGAGLFDFGSNEGLIRFDGSNWSAINTSNSGMISNLVSSMAIDNQGNVWLGQDDILTKFDGINWSYLGCPGGEVSSIIIDSQGLPWIISGNRLVKYNGNDLITIYEAAVTLQSITQGNQNTTWLGGRDYYSPGLLVKWDGTNAIVYDSGPTTYPGDDVDCLAIDNQGVLWFANRNNDYEGMGLTSFNGAVWTTYTNANSQLPDNNINCILIGSDGVKWIGTDSGLLMINGNTWITFNNQNSGLPCNQVLALAKDNLNNIWIISAHEGMWNEGSRLSRLTDNTWFQYTTGLPAYAIFTSICIDNYGNKWLGSNNDGSIGLLMYNEGGVDVLDEHATPSVSTYSLSCYPNPFDRQVAIEFNLDKLLEMNVEVFNLKGQLVRNIYQGTLHKGFHKLIWDGKDSQGRTTGQGIYLIKLSSLKGSEVRKVINIR